MKELVLFLLFVLSNASMRIWGIRNTLDRKFYYTGEEATQLLNGLSPLETQRYLVNEYIDLFYLVVYSALLFFLLKRFYPQRKNLPFAGFLPGAFDVVETLAIIAMLLSLPVSQDLTWLGWVTMVKWSLVGVVLSIILAGFIRDLKTKKAKG